jgi:hypothetical protein
MSNPSVSLLPDNPSAHFTAVQGGGLGTGAELSGGGKKAKPQWKSTPVLIPVTPSTDGLRSTPTNIKKFHTLWKRTLGPSVPSRHQPRFAAADPVFVIGSLNERETKGYVVAPLRGDKVAAQDVLGWAAVQIQMQPETYVIFTEPLTAGGSKVDGELIHRGIESLASKYPGHIVVIGDRQEESSSNLPVVDGLFFYSVPDSERQIAFGYLPDPRLVFERHSQAIESLDIDTIRTSKAGLKRADESEHIVTVSFRKPSTAHSRDKEMKTHTLRGKQDHIWSAPPGWVSQITFGDRGLQAGGRPASPAPGPTTAAVVAPVASAKVVAAAPAPSGGTGLVDEPTDPNKLHTVTLGDKQYKIRKPDDAKEDWKQLKFTKSEDDLLKDQQLRYDNKVYALFLEGLVEEQCNTEASTYLNPACGVFRYIMADRMYQKLKQRNLGVATVRVNGASTAPAAPPAAPVAPVAPAAPAPAAPAPVPAPAPGATHAATPRASFTPTGVSLVEEEEDNDTIEDWVDDAEIAMQKCKDYDIPERLCKFGTDRQKNNLIKYFKAAIKNKKEGGPPIVYKGGTRKIHLGKGKTTRKNRTQ